MGEPINVIECDECLKTFLTKSKLVSHQLKTDKCRTRKLRLIKEELSDDDGHGWCKDCDKFFYELDNLLIHRINCIDRKFRLLKEEEKKSKDRIQQLEEKVEALEQFIATYHDSIVKWL